MIKKVENSKQDLSQFKAREDSDKRQEEIQVVLSLKIGEFCQLETDNIKSWKASFYNYLKEHDIQEKYTFRRLRFNSNVYMVGLVENSNSKLFVNQDANKSNL